MRSTQRKFTGILIIALLVTGLIYGFFHAGRWLVEDDKLVHADLIVVLMGSGPDRILEAIDLNKAGYAEKILMVENNQPGFELLKERDVTIPRDADLAKSVGVQMDVPSGDFIILPGNALSTRDEANRIKAYLTKHHDIKKIILVTSRYHTGRAAKVFRRALRDLDNNVEVIARPSRYDRFNEKVWWRSREDAKHLISEYTKLLAFYTLDR